MAFGFTKSQRTAFTDRVEALKKAESEMQDAVINYNLAVSEAHSAMMGAVEEFEDKRSALYDLLVEVEEENRKEYDDKSDAWRETDRGATVENWIDGVQELASNVESMTQEVEEPEEVTLDANGLDELDDVALAPEFD